MGRAAGVGDGDGGREGRGGEAGSKRPIAWKDTEEEEEMDGRNPKRWGFMGTAFAASASRENGERVYKWRKW